MLSQEKIEILHGVMALFVLFEPILIKLFALIRSPSPNKLMTHFVRTFLVYSWLLQAKSGSRKFWWGDAIWN